uniref:Uncharacterized protein n=1 Tax=Lepeophtheirus salmonis TaxID=72036 RepID=A0A0K2T255_LEPSM
MRIIFEIIGIKIVIFSYRCIDDYSLVRFWTGNGSATR